VRVHAYAAVASASCAADMYTRGRRAVYIIASWVVAKVPGRPWLTELPLANDGAKESDVDTTMTKHDVSRARATTHSAGYL